MPADAPQREVASPRSVVRGVAFGAIRLVFRALRLNPQGLALTGRAKPWSRLTRGLRREQLHPVDFGVLFDADWYRAQWPDIGNVDPLEHFLRKGAAEGRNPNPLFDTKWYLAEYPDVAAAGVNPLVHFIAQGAAEDRNPGPSFDTAWYRAHNPDSTAAENPLAHYLTIGSAVGRRTLPDATRRRNAAIRAASDALDQFYVIDPAVRQQIAMGDLARLPSWTGQALGRRYAAWKKLFASLPAAMDRVVFISSLDCEKSIEFALMALDAVGRPSSTDRTLILSTDAITRAGPLVLPQGVSAMALSDLEPDLTLEDRADVIKTLIYHLRPRIALNAGSVAWWQALRESGAALSIGTELSAILSSEDHRSTAVAEGGQNDMRSCLGHLTKVVFDTPSSRAVFEREYGIPECLREGVVVLSQQRRS